MSDVPNRNRYTAAEVLAMARATIDPREPLWYLRHEIGVNGQPTKANDGSASSIEEAVASSRPFTARMRSDILVIDDDAETGLARAFAEEFLGELVPVLVWSGQGRRQHLLVKVSDPTEMAFLVRAAKDFGVADVQAGRWLRPLGSPHTFAGPSVLVDMAPEDAVEALGPTTALPGYLGAEGRRALLQGPVLRSVKSASEALMSATLAMVACGWNVEDMWRCLMVFSGGEKLRRLMGERRWTQAEARRWWETYTLANAEQRVAASPTVRSKTDALRTVAGMRAWRSARAWKGTGGGTDRAVLGVVLDIATASGKITHLGLSVRQVAEGAGCHWTTARASLRRLAAVGVIEKMAWDDVDLDDDDHHGPHAHRYRLCVPTFESEELRDVWLSAARRSVDRAETQQSDPRGCESLTVAIERDHLAAHDVFRRGALGKTALKVWQALSDYPVTTKNLATELGYKHSGTLRKHLIRLSSVGLALEGEDGWTRSTTDLNALAGQFGTAGASDRQKALHRRERAANDVKRRSHTKTKHVEKFCADHLIYDPNGALTYGEVRMGYWRWCGKRRTPLSDFAFYAAIHQIVSNAPPIFDPAHRDQPTGPWQRLNMAPMPLRLNHLPAPPPPPTTESVGPLRCFD